MLKLGRYLYKLIQILIYDFQEQSVNVAESFETNGFKNVKILENGYFGYKVFVDGWDTQTKWRKWSIKSRFNMDNMHPLFSPASYKVKHGKTPKGGEETDYTSQHFCLP